MEIGLRRIRVLSFDMEGTLVDPYFSHLVWEVDIPRLYAEQRGLGLEEAREHVFRGYREVGEERVEWYDIGYWFRRLGLGGDWRGLLESRRGVCRLYPEVRRVLERLRERYTLIVTSNTIREFLEVQLLDLKPLFTRVFSAPSDFGEVKKSPEVYMRVCRELDVEPEAVAHVGDHPRFDYEVPRMVGIRAYHLDREYKSSGEHVVHNLEDFEKRIKMLESLGAEKPCRSLGVCGRAG